MVLRNNPVCSYTLAIMASTIGIANDFTMFILQQTDVFAYTNMENRCNIYHICNLFLHYWDIIKNLVDLWPFSVQEFQQLPAADDQS